MRAPRLVVAAWVLGAALAGAALAQQAAPAKAATPASPAAKPARTTGGPAWNELSPAQKQSLAPLAAQWGTISEAQKRKWIALSQNYPKLSADEQAKLHSRMTEWVALSPQQRTQARLNFADTRRIPPDDKKAKWEAYQSLTPEEKARLAAKARPKAAGAAAAVKPVPPQKLAKVPPKTTPDQKERTRIAAPPHQVDHNTLLPQKRIAATPAPASPPSN
ncbi:MAG: DUF3106 domain-containing protein [Ramlibacter sp.]